MLFKQNISLNLTVIRISLTNLLCVFKMLLNDVQNCADVNKRTSLNDILNLGSVEFNPLFQTKILRVVTFLFIVQYTNQTEIESANVISLWSVEMIVIWPYVWTIIFLLYLEMPNENREHFPKKHP